MVNRNDLRALRNILDQARLVLHTEPVIEARTRVKELLDSAISLTDDMISAPTVAAAALGRKGGRTTAARLGSEHFRQLAAMRKTRAGGRPRKES